MCALSCSHARRRLHVTRPHRADQRTAAQGHAAGRGATGHVQRPRRNRRALQRQSCRADRIARRHDRLRCRRHGRLNARHLWRRAGGASDRRRRRQTHGRRHRRGRIGRRRPRDQTDSRRDAARGTRGDAPDGRPRPRRICDALSVVPHAAQRHRAELVVHARTCRVVSATAIRLERLGKRYGRLTALRDVSLDVPAGDVFGFLGLNGAGKTTTIRILIDLVRPTTGRAAVFDRDCQSQGRDVRAQVGYLPGEPGFYGDMTGEATLDLLGRLSAHRIDPAWRRALVDRLEFAASDLARPTREYSAGMKRKLGIVQAFQADAPLLVLDEPTEGLDPLMQEAFYQLLTDVRGRGRTVFMSSHVVAEVERVCDRLALLRGGAVALVSTIEALRNVAGRRVRVSFTADVEPLAVWPHGCEALGIEPRVWNLRVRGPLGPLVTLLASRPLTDLDVETTRLEE